MPFISAVIPVFNSADTLEELYLRLTKSLIVHSSDYEIIFINDSSGDNSSDIIYRLAENDSNVVCFDLAKNYGQHNANMCGLKHTRGDFVITMDDDLQNPPEEIEKMIRKINGGYDLVIGQFKQKQHAGYRRIGSKLIGLVNRKIFQTPEGIVLTNFRIMRRHVVDKVCNYKTSYPYVPGLVLWFSQDIVNILVEHHPRRAGESNYNLMTILKLVSTILFNYSSFPLRSVALGGMIVSFLSMLLGVGYIVSDLIAGTNVQGWTTIVVLLSFFNGISLLVISMIGEYLVRLLNQSSSSESFHIKEVVAK